MSISNKWRAIAGLPPEKKLTESVQVNEANKLDQGLCDQLDKKAKGTDEVEHNGKKYIRSGPKNSVSQAGSWREASKLKEDSVLAEALKMAKVHVVQVTPKDIEGLKDDVFGIMNESPVVEELIALLGIQDDGTPIRIRTGFMSYNKEKKILFFSKFKYDMPDFVGKQPKK